MIELERLLSTNRAGWNHVAPSFHGATALPELRASAPTEETLRLLDETHGVRALELGCGSGHSLRVASPSEAHGNSGASISLPSRSGSRQRRFVRLRQGFASWSHQWR